MNQQATKLLGSSLKSVKPSPHKLGDLLIKAGYVTQHQVDSITQQFSEAASAQLGQLLILDRHINHDDLAAALRAQALIRDNLVDSATAIKALQLRRPMASTFDEALAQIQDLSKEAATAPTNRLGDLLVESGIIGAESLEQALKKSESTGLPLGRILILSGIISESLLFAALNAQVLVRDQSLQRDQAVRALAAAQRRQIPIEQSLKDLGFNWQRSRQEVRLGELLCAAALVDEVDITNAIELGLNSALPIGEILISEGMVSQHVLTLALEYQQLIRDGQMDLWQAARALRDSQSLQSVDQRNLDQYLDEFAPPTNAEGKAEAIATAPASPKINQNFDQAIDSAIDQVLGAAAAEQLNRTSAAPLITPAPPKEPLAQSTALKIPPALPPLTEQRHATANDAPERASSELVIEFSDFLILTKIASREQLKKASQMCSGTQFPLTRALVILNVTTKGIMELVSEAFLRVTSRRLSLDEAVFIVDFARDAFANQPANLQAILLQLGWDS